MAHFAKIEDGVVVTVNVINNADILDEDGIERPELALPLLGDGHWVQCSYNGNFRGAYPGIGWTYDPDGDVFVSPPAPEPEPEAESLTETLPDA
jgi:hypothetical protein